MARSVMNGQSLGACGFTPGVRERRSVTDSGTDTSPRAEPALLGECEGSDCHKQLSWW